MPKKHEEFPSHPDDLMVVTLTLEFRAKLNPEVTDPPPFETTAMEICLPATDAAEFVEEVLKAIQERRLYGFMVQELATNAVGAKQWIEKPFEEVLAEASDQDRPISRT